MHKLTLLNQFIQFVSTEKLFMPDQTVLIAVSGGADSVVLCELFHQAAYPFAIAHCNFQLRAEASDGDALFVQQLAEKYHVPFHIARFDTIAYQKENKLSPEEAARDLRYSFFERISAECNYAKIATAHHLNDNIETLFLHLIRGTGMAGITGIPLKNKKIIRPLLFATRTEIENFAAENNIVFRTDASNFIADFDRNKIRNEIIPLLKKMNPSLEQTMQHNIQHFNDVAIIYRGQVQKKLNKLIQKKRDDLYLPIAAIKNLPAATTYLHEFLFPYGFNAAQLEDIIRSFGVSGKFFYSATHRVLSDRSFIILSEIKKETESVIYIAAENKTVSFSTGKLHFEYSEYKKGMQFNDAGNIAYFDAEQITFPLVLRIWEKGDYLYPIGLTKKKSNKPGKKKVSDLLTDAKYNLLQKENTRVLLSGEKIIWLVGLRQDERFKVSDKTKRLLKIKMLQS